MKTPLLLLGICAGLYGTAQTIELADTLSTGDLMTYYVLDSNATDYADVTGASVNWDYSNIGTYMGIASNDNPVIDATASDYADDFPTARYSEDFENSVKTFFTNDAGGSQTIVHGFVFQEESSDFIIKYDVDPLVSFNYPMNQGDSYTDAIDGTATVSGTNVDIDGSATITADGSGTLVVGTETYTNVIRVHTVETSDGILLGQPVSIRRESYVYYDIDNFNMPVFIHATVNADAGPGGEFGFTAVYSRTDVTNFVGVQENELVTLNLSVYPNPNSTDFATVTTVEGTQTLSIISSLGQVVRTINNPTTTEKIDISDLSQGVYFVQVMKDGATRTEKFVIK